VSASKPVTMPGFKPARLPLSRRALLRGAGGLAVALPFLDAMAPRRAHAAGPAPRRLLTFFTENGVVAGNWFPSGSEKAWTMPVSLAPLMPFQKHLIVFEGLDHTASGSNGGGGHQRGKTAAFTAQGNNNGRAAGISIDQAIANAIGTTTRFKSIEASVYLKGVIRDGVYFSGPGQIIVPEDVPAMLFARLFTDPLPTQAPADPALAGRLRARKRSILDQTMEQYQRLAGQVGGGDRSRLDAHATAIRSLEQSLGLLEGTAAEASAACKKPSEVNPTDFVTTGKAQMDLLAMGLACDLTRVASLQWRSSMTAFPWVSVSAEHHVLSHQTGNGGADASLTKIVTWHTQQFAYLLGLLQATPDAGGGTLLDNTLVYWPNELSNGRHRLQNVPIVIATGDFTTSAGQKLATGRYLKYPGGTMDSGLLTRLGQMFGLPITNFGGTQWHHGPLPNLL
jgi:hypothetical protein